MSANVYLIGMPGSGKSSTGRILAKNLSVPFIDLDEEIEAAAGLNVQEIFRAEGEPGFRAREKSALSLISARNRAVVACGGGVVLDPDNRTILKASGVVVWLKASAERLAERDLEGRPLLKEPGDLERLTAERRPLYEQVADHTIEASESPEEVAAEIAESLR